MSDVLAVLNVIILAMTTAIVWYYTWETRRLREAAQRQIELQLRPFLVAIPVPGGSGVLDRFFMDNIGNGAALNVCISWGITSLSIPFLPRSERIELLRVETGEARALNEPADYPSAYGHYAFPLDTESARQGVILCIDYDNVEHEHYKTKIRIGPLSATVEPLEKMLPRARRSA